ncbi:MAG: hypothetical protein WBB27_10000, partial [Maribacter sp.]
MKIYLKTISILFLIVAFACKDKPKSEEKEAASDLGLSSEQYIPEIWIVKRVEKAKNKLGKSEAGKVVWNAMVAHGGLDTWYKNGPLSFRFNYQPLDTTKAKRDSYQTIDTWSNKARHTSAADSTAHYGWTGETAWVKAIDSTAFAYDTKFWALTPIYFLGHPFILDGEGVNLEL